MTTWARAWRAGASCVKPHERSSVRGSRHHHHGQHLSVWRHGRGAVRRRHRRRALRRAQFGCAGCDRGGGRSLLRVHDRRRGVRAGPHGRQFRRGIHRRLCLCARPRARLRRPLQSRAHRHQPRVARRHGRARPAPARPDRAAMSRSRAASGAPQLLNDFRSYIGKFLGGEAQGRGDRDRCSRICGAPPEGSASKRTRRAS